MMRPQRPNNKTPVSQDTCWVVIDAQNDFCLPEKGCSYYDRSISEKRPDDMLPILRALQIIEQLLKQVSLYKIKIAALQSSYSSKQFSDESPMDHLALKDTFGWQLAVKLPGNAIVIEKFEHDGSENLVSALPNTKRFVLCGFTTDNCITATAEGLLDRGLEVIVLNDCTATAAYKFPGSHQTALNRLKGLGAYITESDKFINSLRSQSNRKELKILW